MNVWWWNRDTCGSGKGTEKPRDNARRGWRAGESKRKEFKYSNFKNSCPCKITEMKAEIQLVEEAAITCSYCQSNAHSRIVQPLCKLQRAEDSKPRAVQHRPKQMIFQGSHVFLSSLARPTWACWGHTAFLLTQVLEMHQACGATPGSDHHMRMEPSHHQQSIFLQGLPSVWALRRLCAASLPKR